MQSSKEISIIISTYNKDSRLWCTLESLRYQSLSVPIYIVDDGSEDNTYKVIREFRNSLNLNYIFQKNSGRSHARNNGLQYIDSKYVIFCDDDLILSPFFVENHLRFLKENPSTLIHGKIWNLPYLSYFRDPVNGIFYENIKKNIGSNKLMKYLISKDDIKVQENISKQKRCIGLEKKLVEIDMLNIDSLKFMYCTGGNFSVEVQEIKSVGGFDTSLDKYWGCEDLELGYRLRKSGIKFMYSAAAYNYHISHYRHDYKDNLTKSFKLFYEKHEDEMITVLPKFILDKKYSLNDFVLMYNLK